MMRHMMGCSLVALLLSPQMAVAEDKLNLAITGYQSFYAGFADQDDGVLQPGNNRRSHDLKRDGRVGLRGSHELANGLLVGADITLRDYTATEQLDTSYLYFSGNWGRAEIGANFTAPYTLAVHGPVVDAQFDGLDPNVNFVNNGDNNASIGHAVNYQNSYLTERFTYLTPIWQGTQLGISYSPNDLRQGGGSSKAGANNGMDLDNRQGRFEDIWEMGARYQRAVGAVDFALSAGYGMGSLERQNNTNSADDLSSWTFGGNINYAGWSFGGAAYHDNLGQRDNDQDSWRLGLSYQYQDWQFAGSYMDSERERGRGVRQDEWQRWMLGANYNLASGVSLRGSVQLHQLDGATIQRRNDATVFTLGTMVNF